jgi:redox-sensitive bicupin YhaK (pirin superfamily)
MLVLDARASQVRPAEHSTAMMLVSEPVREHFIYWNITSSSEDRLALAAPHWTAGRMTLPVADDAEFIPLPDEPAPSAPAMS